MSDLQNPIVSIDDPQAIPYALAALASDELIVFPTDTLYGLAGRINETSLQKIYSAKQRPDEKAIPVLVGDQQQLYQLASKIEPQVMALMQVFWPGPLTLVVPKKAGLPPSLSPYPGLALRMPDHHLALTLLQQTGPLAVTSANISGGQNPITAEDVYAQLKGRVDLILDGGKLPGGKASTVVDCQSDAPILLREGPIPFEDILNVWGKA
ncbi:MAG: L-threonylcarbamoyladenylate synthase [Anaerolineaceae bacterium]|jgi:L-threonylcarbamoyladenylate synthase|nr:L-threonylcarbamoyladenylate synthase [Anaerolineaceae bacterium]